MSTEFLLEKINALKNMIQQEELTRFNYQLIVEDAQGTSGNTSVDEQMTTQAQSAMAQVSMSARKLATRRKYLEQYQSEWDELQQAKESEAAATAAPKA